MSGLTRETGCHHHHPTSKDCARFSDCLPGRGPYSLSLFLTLALSASHLFCLSRFCLSLRRHPATPRQINIDKEGPSSQAQRQRGEREREGGEKERDRGDKRETEGTTEKTRKRQRALCAWRKRRGGKAEEGSMRSESVSTDRDGETERKRRRLE